MRPETRSGWPHKCRVWKLGTLWMTECPDCGTVQRSLLWDTAVVKALGHLESA